MLVLSLILINQLSVAQKYTDSDSVLVQTSHEAFEALIHVDQDSARFYLDRLKQLSTGLEHPRAKFMYPYDLAYYYFTHRKLDSSYFYYRKSLDIAKSYKLKKEAVQAKIWVSNHYYFKNDEENAKRLLGEVLLESTEINFVDGIANAYYALSKFENNAEKILLLHLKIDSLYNAHGTYSPILSNSLGAVGQIYLEANFIESAKEYYEKAFEIAEKTNYIPGLTNAREIRGEIALKQGEIEKAKVHFERALKEAQDKKDTFLIAQNLVNMSLIDTQKTAYKNAIERLVKAERLYISMKDSNYLTHVNLQLAKNYIALDQLPNAKRRLDHATTYPNHFSENNYRIDLLETSIQYYEAKGSFPEAFELLKQLQLVKTEIEEKRNSVAFIEYERRNAIEKNQQKIELLNSEKELLEQRQRNQRNIFLGGIGFISLIGIFLYLLLRNRQKTNKKLRELDQLKSNFFTNISHEFRTPLTLISGPIEKRLESGELSEQDRKELEMMQRNSSRLLGLVDQLLDLSKLEAGKYKIRAQFGDLGSLIRAVSESFQFKAEQTKIDYSVEVEGLEEAWFDKDVIEKILTNLLSNAFKYTEKGGQIMLKATRQDQELLLIVENGPSLSSPSSVEKLFDRFYQSDSRKEGVGVGLSLVKELAVLNRGDVSIKQTGDRNLCFKTILPISKEDYSKDELSSHDREEISSNIFVPSSLADSVDPDVEFPEKEGDEREIVLVVEDNKDVRTLIRESLEPHFRVLQAEDGSMGIDTATQWIPDLIISDILMPGIDGIELCQNLKKDERTSHIPIILLTAKAGDEDQYRGLSSGADAYVTKPFKMKLLKTRVEKLVESRKLLRDRYSQEVVLKAKDIAISDVDEQFLGRVQEVIDQKLTESQFSAKEFSEAVGMSRMQLHRKLKALTGLSATEFVRSQRLKLAASLLQSSNASVSDIGYQVGFNDPSYFTRCFKEAYGCSPTEYSQKQLT